ncbi:MULTISPECIES: type VII secretion-associated protein [unclassified Mycobacterium]|uniref:type VII secretion-associated protein n=1 Tax=unclassified Mycobacterium TaxID=2642494 RepID=UPI00068C20FE|nr:MULTISPECIES: type VII secretion-associated protein [unclassified Mycobacterium]SEB12034.1 type VII secretion-associated protein, Rv3446c family, C-terminal domain-containing protein [Mycobacterium sp. 283mftsu]
MTVVVVGPNTIRGPGDIDADLVSSALECVDEPLGLLRTAVLPAQHIWRDVMAAAAGTASAITVVCPTWWTPSRIERVRTAVPTSVSHVVIERRTDALRAAGGEPDCTVIELGEDIVTISRPGAAASVVRRTDSATAEAVIARTTWHGHVVIDAPIGVPGAAPLAAEMQALLQDQGVPAQILSCDDLLDQADEDSTRSAAATRSPRARIATAFAAAVAVIGAGAVGLSNTDAPAPPVAAVADPEFTWLVEGRVAVQIPVRWTVGRALAGAGSARLQIISPDDHGQVIHLTQSVVPREQTLDVAARSLREASTKLPDGVIVDFEEAGVSAGRAAVRYREVRSGRTVEWSVLLDGPVRIAVGCQGAAVQPACDTAIRSARRTD